MNQIPRWILAIAALSLLLIAGSIASNAIDEHKARNECVTYATGAQSNGCD